MKKLKKMRQNSVKSRKECKMDKKEILEAVKDMNVLEVKELVEMFEEEFGVSAAAVAVAASGAAADAGDDKSEYDVVLAEVGGEKIKVIKAIREITGLGLKEAKEMVDGAPGTVKEAVAKEEAENMKKTLEEVGAKVELK